VLVARGEEGTVRRNHVGGNDGFKGRRDVRNVGQDVGEVSVDWLPATTTTTTTTTNHHHDEPILVESGDEGCCPDEMS